VIILGLGVCMGWRVEDVERLVGEFLDGVLVGG
jgi:hypothetical protein